MTATLTADHEFAGSISYEKVTDGFASLKREKQDFAILCFFFNSKFITST